MPPEWDPEQYRAHATNRARPFHDLLNRIPDPPPRSTRSQTHRITDLGCGTADTTALLLHRWPHALVTGVDNSEQMIRAATPLAGPTHDTPTGRLDLKHADLTTWRPCHPQHLILSNAALQWVPDHTEHLPRWIDHLTPGGTLAFQVPGNFDAPSHTLLAELRASTRWRDRLHTGADRSAAVHTPEDYLALLTDHGCTVDVWETTYLHLLTGEDPVLDWTRGTALRPVLSTLRTETEREQFLSEYRQLLRAAYPPGPHGTVFPFRRIFAVATRKD